MNNLEYLDRTADNERKGSSIQPFYRPGDVHPALYLGFDKPPLKGPISMYVNVQDQEYAESSSPRLEWEYYRSSEGRRGWARLNVQDDTCHLTQSGCVMFVGLPDFAIPAGLFGKSLYWIRAIDAEDRFKPVESRALPAQMRSDRNNSTYPAAKDDDCGCGPAPCADFVLFDARFTQASGGNVPAPKLNGIYLNTTMAAHSESISGEIIGSGSGNASAAYQLTKFPVLSQQIYVNELSALSEEERGALLADANAGVREIKDDNGVTTAFWVLWTATDNLGESDNEGRHYEIDRTFGHVQFGDGIHGKVPPIGTDNLSADYEAGGGSAGNIGPGEAQTLRTSIAYVDRASNPYAFECGYETETVEHALERGPLAIRTRNRAVTAADYEQLALQASRGIARVKCLPGFNDKGERETGWVTVVIVPQSSEARPVPAPQLRQQVEAFLRERAANVIAAPRHIKALGPLYAEVAVSARIVANSFDAVPAVEQAANHALGSYLHPLTGGKDGRGWAFGKLPCLSDFYALFEADRNVDHVEALTMTIRDPASGKALNVTPKSPLDIRTVPYLLIYSGEHRLVVTSLAVN